MADGFQPKFVDLVRNHDDDGRPPAISSSGAAADRLHQLHRGAAGRRQLLLCGARPRQTFRARGWARHFAGKRHHCARSD